MCNLIFRCLLTFINWRQSDRLIGPQEAWRSGGLAGARRAWSSVDAHAALHQQAASAGLSSAGDSWTCGLLVKGARSAATSSIFKETIEKGLLFFFFPFNLHVDTGAVVFLFVFLRLYILE